LTGDVLRHILIPGTHHPGGRRDTEVQRLHTRGRRGGPARGSPCRRRAPGVRRALQAGHRAHPPSKAARLLAATAVDEIGDPAGGDQQDRGRSRQSDCDHPVRTRIGSRRGAGNPDPCRQPPTAVRSCGARSSRGTAAICRDRGALTGIRDGPVSCEAGASVSGVVRHSLGPPGAGVRRTSCFFEQVPRA
jgi:hypothetical protein